MADISKIKTLDGTVLNLKDSRAYRKGEDVRHRNSSIDQAPQYVSLITNKMTSEELQTIRTINGVGDYFYALHLNPNYTVTCNYSGQHGTKGNFAISTLFAPSGSSTVLLDVDSIAQTPFVLTIMKKSGNITATDVVNLELFTHTLGNSNSRLTDYKVELYTTGSTASSGEYSWQTVYERSNVSDSMSGLIICLNATSYPYLYFQGVRFTISGATPDSTNPAAWDYNCIDLSLFRLIDQRPTFTAARAVGALDIAGGEVYGPTTFYNTITGNLNGSASKVNNHTVNKDVPSDAKFTDTTYSDATTSASGLMSSSDKTKLNGIDSGAEVNQNAFSNVVVGSTTIAADGKTDTLTLVAGSNVTLTPDASNDKVTIAATDTTYESKAAASGGTAVSLVTTGEKYTWNNKGTYSKPSGGIPDTDIASASTWNAKLDSSLKGANNGVAELDSTGKVPSSQLPSYVDDVLEYDSQSAFPSTGETGKIYVAKDTNKTYRWSGTAYVEISPSLALGETSSTAYRGDRGKTAYDHASSKGSAFASGLYKVTTNSEGHVTAATAVQKSDITALGIPGQDTTYTPASETPLMDGTAAVGSSAKYAREDHRHPSDTSKIDRESELLTTNSFAPVSLRGPYISKIDNGFYAADKRWNISMTNISSGAVSALFDGNYESAVWITNGDTSVLTMDFSTESNGYFPGYPYGYILVSFYANAVPVSVSGRVYCNYQSQGIGWHDIAFTKVSDSTVANTVYRSNNQAYYNISLLEITIVGDTENSYGRTQVCQVEMHLTRPDSRKTPFLSKYGAEELYYPLTAPNFIGQINGHTVNKDVPSDAKFTDTTYESKSAASGGTAVSLVTTGEKYTWNNKGTYSKPSGGIPDSDIASASTWNAKGTYSKPSGGIPKTDLASDVQTSLDSIGDFAGITLTTVKTITN